MDYQKEYKDHCLTCKKYDIYSKSDATVRGYRCIHHHRPMAMDEKCSSYGFDYARSNSMIEDAIEWIGKRGYDPRPDAGSCYITSIICHILGLPDNCEYLTNFRRLRDEYMVTFPEGLKQLYAYDTFGVQISMRLEKDFNTPEKREATVKMVKEILLPDYIVKVNELIKAGNFAMAMYAYVQMTMTLSNKYGINYIIPDVDVESLDKETIGHGRGFAYEGA